MSDQLIISLDEAVKLLPEGDTIHTFRIGGAMIIGADWSRESIISAMGKTDIHVAGEKAHALHHGLAIIESGRWLFIEASRYVEDAS